MVDNCMFSIQEVLKKYNIRDNKTNQTFAKEWQFKAFGIYGIICYKFWKIFTLKIQEDLSKKSASIELAELVLGCDAAAVGLCPGDCDPAHLLPLRAHPQTTTKGTACPKNVELHFFVLY